MPRERPDRPDIRSACPVQGMMHESTHLARQRRHPLRDRARSQDRAPARRHHQGDRLRDLRLRPASLSTASSRRWKAATCWAMRRWARLSRSARTNNKLEGRRPRRRALHDRLRRMLLLQARLLLRLRTVQSRTRRRPRSCGGTRRPGCSAIRICSAAIAGGQAEYLRVPYADVGPIKVPDGLTRRAGAVPVGHLSDRLHGRGVLQHQSAATRSPSGAAARSAQFAIRSAFLLGAERVIAIDTVPERLAMAADSRRR